MATCYVASPQFTLNDKGPNWVASEARKICAYLEALKLHPAHLKVIDACIAKGDTWERMARRVLVVGGLLKQGCVDLVQPHAIDAVVDQCAAMPENRDAVQLAVRTCCFDFSSVLHPGKPTLCEMVARMPVSVSIGRRFLAAHQAQESLNSRQLSWRALHAPARAASNVVDVLNSEIIGASVPRVVAVSGTSGSGKTVAALEAATRYVHESSNAAVSTLYMLGSDIPNINAINKMMTAAEKATRNKEVESAILAAVKEVVKDPPAKRADGQNKTTAVLVLDEMGEYANFVRGVCAARPFITVQQHLNVERVVVMVVGTGVDVATNAVGSCPDTFVRAHVDSKSVSCSLLRTMAGVNLPALPTDQGAAEAASPLEQLLKECEAWRRALEHAPRLRATLSDMSHNPRMVAALGEYFQISTTKYQRDADNDLAARLEHGVDFALERFVMLNGLAKLDFRMLLACFSRAFAMSLESGAGAEFDIRSELVVRKYGLVADLAEWCVADAPRDPLKPMQKFGDLTCKSPAGKEHVLCLPEGRTQRYEMSPAMVALSFRLFGRRYPEWSGDGFERTLAEYLSWVGLAAHSGMAITISDADPLARLKRALVAMGLDGDGTPWNGMLTLWRVVLEAPVTSVEAAAKVLTERVVASEGRHLVVALNAPLAPFADILIGLVEVKGGAATLRSMVLIQAKHKPGNRGTSLRAVLPPMDCYYELAKMGYASRNTTVATAWDAFKKNEVCRCATALVRLGVTLTELRRWRKCAEADARQIVKTKRKDKAKVETKRPLREAFNEKVRKELRKRLETSQPTVQSRDCMWIDDPSTMLRAARLHRATASEVKRVARALGCAGNEQGRVSPPNGCEGDSPKIPKTAWFIVLRAPDVETTKKDDAHPEELLWFNDKAAMAAFSPSSLGKFVVIKKRDIAPLRLEPMKIAAGTVIQTTD